MKFSPPPEHEDTGTMDGAGTSNFSIDRSGTGGGTDVRGRVGGEMVARRERGDGIKRVARELGVDR